MNANHAMAAANMIALIHMAPIIVRVGMVSSCVQTNADVRVSLPKCQLSYPMFFLGMRNHNDLYVKTLLCPRRRKIDYFVTGIFTEKLHVSVDALALLFAR